MAVRPYWRGYLKLSLVTCAVTLSPGTTDGEKVRFHTLNRKTNDRIRTRYVDSVSGKLVDDDDQARAYPKGEDDYVILEEEDLDAVQLESTRTIDINEFVEADTIEWVYFDSPYFILPADEVGEEAYVVIREAMAQNNVVGISRLVLGNRERAVMLQPWGKGIILWTLRFGDEVRDEDEYFDKVPQEKTEGDLQSMVEKLIEQRTTAWSESMVKDEVQDNLLKLIKSKDKKRTAAKRAKDPEEEATPATNVIDLMAALKKSLEGKPSGKSKKS
jgi:DNA end-binding protein Ku